MKHMLVDGDTPFHPQEIITNILKRLPIKSIIQSQYVCKRWKNLIKNPSFIAEHLHHQNPSLLFQHVHIWDHLYLCLLSRKMQFREVENLPLIDSLVGVQIVGSSNGAFYVSPVINGTFLWNPAIKGVRQLPMTIDDFPGECSSGFGYSPIINDYKIVKIYVTDAICRMEVYSLSTGLWKVIEFENFERSVGPLTNATTVNGVMFWYGLKASYRGSE